MDTADAVVTRPQMVAWSLYGHDIRAGNLTTQSDGPSGLTDLSSGDSGGQITHSISSSISDCPVLPADDHRPPSPRNLRWRLARLAKPQAVKKLWTAEMP